MAYGIEIRNEFGEDVTEILTSFRIAETGMTVNANTVGLVQGGNLSMPLMDIPRVGPPYPHIMKNDFRVLINEQGNPVQFSGDVPWPLEPRESMYFFQVAGVGMRFHLEIMKLLDDFVGGITGEGLYGVMIPGSDTPVPFIRIDSDFSSAANSETYGMQIRGPANEIWFDSRQDFLSVSEVLFVSKAQITSVISNNATIDLTLRTPVPDAYISTPNHSSFQIVPGGNGAARARLARIRQINSTTLRIDRTDYGSGFTTDTGYGIFNDLVIIVARNPFA